MNDPTVQVTRRCSKCGTEKPATREFFHGNRNADDGCDARCKVCCKRIQRDKLLARGGVPCGRPIAERLWEKVDTSGGPNACWPWTGTRVKQGYGRIHSGEPRSRKMRPTHVVAWECTNGPMPPGAWGLHRCDNPPCCNPAHIFPGTYLENVADKVAKGRQMRGARNPSSKLTEEKVREIRRRVAGGEKQCALEAEFGVQNLSGVVNRKSWKHVG